MAAFFASVSIPKVKLDVKCLILSLKKVLKLIANVESASEADKLVSCWFTSKLVAILESALGSLQVSIILFEGHTNIY